MDISNAFLHGTLEEEVYMDQPPGFIDASFPSDVCKLQKALYGLKQAPRTWFSIFSKFLLSQGFCLSHSDSSLFVRKTSSTITIILIYVNDILFTSSDSCFIASLLQQISLIGGLQYLTITRLDLGLAINQACQHMQAPTNGHFAQVKRLLRYVKGTLHYGLSFSLGPFFLQAFTDSNWASDGLDRCSISGFCVYLGPNLLSWSAKKQPTVSCSSIEAEYRSMAYTTAELCWIQ
ncbi:uncharacterized protein LOC114263037 [Camellia sinensis]|uniref:uncharacterized protein LOC114263037 n=1 Tax=Camellia sinensis TaxID=4442 RepID=UPI00103686AC|nr:uncharacterized protein LOC114263037 [Camellia sinensis]